MFNGKRWTLESFKEEATKMHKGKYNYDKVAFDTISDHVTIICPIHGEFSQIARNHLKGHGCRKCSAIETQNKRKFSRDDFISRAIQKHSGLYEYDLVDYKDMYQKVIIMCRDHGPFLQAPYAHLHGEGCPKCGLILRNVASRCTLENFVEKAKKVHGEKYDYSKSIYKTAQSLIIISCPIHGEFKQRPYSHLAGEGCPLCGRESASQKRRKSFNLFLKQAHITHGYKYNYDKATDYICSDSKVTITCPIHGDFKQRAIDHINGHGCKKCWYELMTQNKSMTQSDFISRAMQVHGNKYDYSLVKYKNSITPVEIICSKHGVFKQKPVFHLEGFGCRKCGLEKSRLARLGSIETFIARANLIHDGRYDYSESVYQGFSIKLKILCPVHGAFYQTPGNHLSGHGCPLCNASTGEIRIHQYLKAKGISYEPQKTFEDLKYKRKLRYDFYIPSNHLLIEFNGIQHYKPVDCFGGEDSFLHRQKLDKKKEAYAKRNGIKLLVIPYWDKENIDEILNSHLLIDE